MLGSSDTEGFKQAFIIFPNHDISAEDQHFSCLFSVSDFDPHHIDLITDQIQLCKSQEAYHQVSVDYGLL